MISTVSIMGADDSVLPEDLMDISVKYPFVEWGLDIYPEKKSSIKWLNNIIHNSNNLRLLGILQGKFKHDFLNGKLSIKLEHPQIWNSLNRIQIDITTNGCNRILESIKLISDKEIALLTKIPFEKEFSKKINAYPLLSINNYSNKNGYCGYQINDFDDLNKIHNNINNFWISINNFKNNQEKFDLLMVEKFLDKCESYVTNNSLIKVLLETESIKQKYLNC